MTTPDWWRFGLAVAERDEERASEALGELGLDALEIVMPGPAASIGPAPGEVWLHAYVEPDERDTREAQLRTLAASLLGARVLETVPISRDAWSHVFEPVCVGSVALRAAGDTSASLGERHVVWMHPGMGFGAGEHPTTRLALAVLERAMRPGLDVVDVGAGTGVLALAALRLGARRAVAVDLAPDARRACRENAALNALPLDVFEHTPTGERFDVVVANILTPVLLELQPTLEAAADGVIILSGVRAADLGRIEAAYAAWRVVDREDEDGWVAVRLARATAT